MERLYARVPEVIRRYTFGGDFETALVPAEFGVQETLVKADPDRYFVPPYVGSSGWVGARLTGKPE